MLACNNWRGTPNNVFCAVHAAAEAKEEVKLDTTARLLQRGISPQEVAAALELDLETVNNIASTQL
ncbi:hypothetical protein NIES2101_08620 [Calothrix sp. HK-06]|nr:hypothetical protein NIES2101_08620 [Calothrix sp. HK-06]